MCVYVSLCLFYVCVFVHVCVLLCVCLCGWNGDPEIEPRAAYMLDKHSLPLSNSKYLLFFSFYLLWNRVLPRCSGRPLTLASASTVAINWLSKQVQPPGHYLFAFCTSELCVLFQSFVCFKLSQSGVQAGLFVAVV